MTEEKKKIAKLKKYISKNIGGSQSEWLKQDCRRLPNSEQIQQCVTLLALYGVSLKEALGEI